jgi:hypothetical protein
VTRSLAFGGTAFVRRTGDRLGVVAEPTRDECYATGAVTARSGGLAPEIVRKPAALRHISSGTESAAVSGKHKADRRRFAATSSACPRGVAGAIR